MEEFNNKFLIRVGCETYNHAAYIIDAMNGFCLQKTKFPFLCIIMDDASTDDEPDVINKYLIENFQLNQGEESFEEETNDYKLIFSRHKSNKNCYFAVFFLKYNHYSPKKLKRDYLKEEWKQTKYVAFCEGDDYWTDPNKLQKQVDFLEAHPNYSICFHNAEILNETKYSFNNEDLKEREYNTSEIAMGLARVHTATIMIRAEAIKINSDKRLLNGDIFLILSGLNHGKGFALKDRMSVYRRHPGGVSVKKRHGDTLDYLKRFIPHNQYLKETFPKITNKTYKLMQSKIYWECYFVSSKSKLKRIGYLTKAFWVSPVFVTTQIKNWVKKKLQKA